MYNIIIVVVLILLLFILSHDEKFAKLFTKNSSFQIITGIILAYFSLNHINFGILLVATILMILRYSYFNRNMIAPLKDKYKTPLITDLYDIIDKFTINDEQIKDIPIDKVELQQLFENLDNKMNSIINN